MLPNMLPQQKFRTVNTSCLNHYRQPITSSDERFLTVWLRQRLSSTMISPMSSTVKKDYWSCPWFQTSLLWNPARRTTSVLNPRLDGQVSFITSSWMWIPAWLVAHLHLFIRKVFKRNPCYNNIKDNLPLLKFPALLLTPAPGPAPRASRPVSKSLTLYSGRPRTVSPSQIKTINQPFTSKREF